jgi:poly(3-hydroxybutyrate) depolymerase/peptidoglycan/LPS O-acetylase OafA/YrhL
VSSALSEASQPVPSEPAGAASAQRRSRPHIIAFDAIRLIIMVFVVSVHTLAFAGGTVTMSIGAVTTVFHTSRELFLLLTALVLTYNYGKRDHLRTGKFWWRRFYLVLPAYVAWSAIYYAANGTARGAWPSAFLHDLQNAGARYHLYFLLVSMQIYLLFPLIRWVLRKTERYHGWLFAAALAYQVWLSIALHYKIWRGENGHLLAQFLGGAATGNWITTYVFYVVAGALAGWHFEALCAFTRRHLRSGWRAGAVAAAGLAVGLGVFLIETQVYGATPANASAVFQPVVIFEALTFGWALLGFGLLWSDRGAPGKKFAAAGSASSFGIYLAHPLVLQVLLLVAGASFFGSKNGLVGDLHRLPHSSLEVVILLLVAVPLIYAVSWVIASIIRRTPLSLPLTGREWRTKRTKAGRAIDRTLDKTENLVAAGARYVPRRLAVVAAVVAVVAAAGVYTGERINTYENRTMNTVLSAIQVGSMTRDYATLTPVSTTLAADAPIIVALSGINGETAQEISRDQLTSYVRAGDAEVVYPVAYRESWNAIGCCSWAADAKVDDVGFMKALVKKIDPGGTRPIYLMGYSNGARLAYTIACKDPTLFDGYAAVKGDPMPWCNLTTPVKILQVASTDDTDTAWYTGEKGNFREVPAALVQNNILRYQDGCTTASETSKEQDLTLTTWTNCKNGTTVTFAVYSTGVHSYPRPPGSFPAASQVIWAWMHDTVTVRPQPAAK